ncbi:MULTISPECIES: hypothetical protein [Halomonadaceae]|uniref:hypothetical protein n=1 Tax=Halomonadaceae TaxID=28256 RepID=UPI0015974B06|nr:MULTISPECIES: hypothetical protein [Halomonas]QJQ93906.1 hypothetical protein HIO72_00420 [Halomonas sp. PA5]
MTRASGAGGGGYGGAVGAGVGASASGGRSGGNTGGNTGGGFGNEVATSGSGGGYGAGHNSTSGGNTGGSSSGGLYGNADTGGVSAGQEAGLGTNEGRASTRAGDRTVGGKGLYGEVDTSPGASVTSGSVTSGALADFGDYAALAEKQFGGWQNEVDYGGDEGYGPNSSRALTQAHEDAGLTARLDSEARGGLLSRGLSLAGGLFGGPVGGLVGEGMSAINSGRHVAGEMARLNEQLGTHHNESLGHHAGRHARGALAGAATGMVGGHALAGVGAHAAGVPGAIGGAVVSGVAADAAHNHAMGATPGGSPNAPTANDGTGPTGGLLASGMPAQRSQPAIAAPSFGVGNFNNYASYAESFFSNFA